MHSPPARAGSSLDGYVTTHNANQQHVDFIDASGHVNELFFDSAWIRRDLSAVTIPIAPTARPQSPLDGYATTFNNQQHVNYVGPNGHVYELFL